MADKKKEEKSGVQKAGKFIGCSMIIVAGIAALFYAISWVNAKIGPSATSVSWTATLTVPKGDRKPLGANPTPAVRMHRYTPKGFLTFVTANPNWYSEIWGSFTGVWNENEQRCEGTYTTPHQEDGHVPGYWWLKPEGDPNLPAFFKGVITCSDGRTINVVMNH